ncbi:MAG: HAD family hydrolase [Thermoanaerobaculales bacterium]
MRVLALDFDGVLCNSSREVFVVAVDAYCHQAPNSRLVDHLRSLRKNALAGGSRYLADPVVHSFSNMLPLGNRAEDFGVALHAVEEGHSISDQAGYDTYFATHQRDWLESYHHRFYEARHRLRARDLGAWLGLHIPYAGLAETLRGHPSDTELAVATAKDAGSVILLLGKLGMADLFEADMILDKETGVEKTHHLQALRDRLDIGFDAITFVDDKVNHLQKVAGLGIRPVLAGWGLNTPREHAAARALGHEIATLDTAGAVLFTGGS